MNNYLSDENTEYGKGLMKRIKHFNTSLKIVCSVLFLVLGGSTLFMNDKPPVQPTMPPNLRKMEKEQGLQVKIAASPFQEYVTVFKQRDIFDVPYTIFPKNTTQQGVEETGSRSTFNLKNYKLVGILIDKKPLAVVEDLRNKQTVFLTVGESLGGAVLEKVRAGSAFFLYESQRWELTQ